MDKKHEILLGKRYGTLDEKTILQLDEELCEEENKIIDLIKEYNKKVQMLYAHAIAKEISSSNIKSDMLDIL